MAMERVTREGRTLNKRTLDMLERAEDRLGYKLHVLQGSYNVGGVSASAGTHDGGGAIDVAPGNPNEIVRALREVGFAAWYRPAVAGLWGEHIHAIAIGDRELSSGAKAQVAEYYAGFDGLAGNGRDEGPRFDPIPTWPIPLKEVPLTTIQNQFKAKKPVKRQAVARVQRVLNHRLGADLKDDGIAGPATRAAWKAWEKKIGTSKDDGIPGEGELTALLKGFFKVKVAPKKK